MCETCEGGDGLVGERAADAEGEALEVRAVREKGDEGVCHGGVRVAVLVTYVGVGSGFGADVELADEGAVWAGDGGDECS